MKAGWRAWAAAVVATVVVLISACGGGGSPGPTLPTPPAPSPAPVASFTAPANAAALAPVSFDASASTSSDGSALSYWWDFGNGRRGAGQKIAQAFAAGGAYNVTLTVTDGQGRSASQTQAISISAPPAPTTTVVIQGRVTGLDGAPIAGVTATAPDGTSAASDAQGLLSLRLGTNVPLLLRLTRSGYADQFVPVLLPPTAGGDGMFEARMRTRDASQTLTDAAAGGAVSGRDGARLVLPANALVDSTGVAVTGPVEIAMTPVDATLPRGGGFPGRFDGANPDASVSPLVSFGTTEFVLSRNGRPLQLAPGRSATIELPIYAGRNLNNTPLAVGDTAPLWSLDETSGIWINEGSGTVVASPTSPTGLALRATVTHFSWWNHDIGFVPYGPEPSCVADSSIDIPGNLNNFANATICNMLAEMDNGFETSQAGPPAAAQDSSQMRRLATPPPQRFPGYSRQAQIPVSGGQVIPVPANNNVLLTATALNGTWVGRIVVNGPTERRERVVVPMRPVAFGGNEAITVPFDGLRQLAASGVARFTFNGVAGNWALIQVTPVAGSPLAGNVRLLQGTTVVAQSAFSVFAPGVIGLPLPSAGATTVEVSASAVAGGGFRLQADQVADVETIALPFDGTRSLYPGQTWRFNFAGTASRWAVFTVRSTTLTATVRLRQGTTVLGSANLAGVPVTLAQPLPSDGTYTIEVANTFAGVGMFQLQGDVVGGLQSEALALPFDITRTLAPYTAWRGNLDVTAPTALHLSAQDRAGNPFTMRVRDASGAVIQSIARSPAGTYPPTTFTLPAAGRYTLDVEGVNGQPVGFRVIGEPTSWITIAPPISVDTTSGFLGLAADRNNVPVLALERGSIVNNVVRRAISIQRLQNGAWSAVAPEAPAIERPCSSVISALAFGADNQPIVAYVERDATGAGASTKVRRWDGAAWIAVGPNNGTLPALDTFGRACDRRPVLRVDAGGAPVLAYLSDSDVVVQRFDGVSWKGLASSAEDRFSALGGSHDMAFDASGRLHLVVSNASPFRVTRVLRLNAATPPAWEPVGPNGGVLPLPASIVDLFSNRLTFDAGGQPIVGSYASVPTSPGVFTTGVAVFRFDGSTWSTTGGYRLSNDSYVNGSYAGSNELAFALSGGEALLAFANTWNALSLTRTVVQRNTAAGWAPFGAGVGQLPQFTPNAVSQVYGQNFALLTIAGEPYLAMMVRTGTGSGLDPSSLQLLRRVP